MVYMRVVRKSHKVVDPPDRLATGFREPMVELYDLVSEVPQGVLEKLHKASQWNW